MATEMDGLPEEVRVAAFSLAAHLHDYQSGHWKVIRAELLRLAREAADLRQASEHLLHAVDRNNRRAERAEAEVAELKRKIAEAETGIVTQLVKHLGPGGPDQVTLDAYPVPFDSLALGQLVALRRVDEGGEG